MHTYRLVVVVIAVGMLSASCLTMFHKRVKPPAKPPITHGHARQAPVYAAVGTPLIPRTALRFGNSVNHGAQRYASFSGQGVPAPAYFSELVGAPGPGDAPDPQVCQTQSLVNLSPNDLVQWLKTHDVQCQDAFLWGYVNDLNVIFSTTNMTAVLNEVAAVAGQYVGTDDQKLLELLSFARIGYYHKYYNPVSFDAALIQPTLVQAMQALANNPHFLDSGEVPGDLLYLWIVALDNSDLGYQLYGKLKAILMTFQNDLSRLAYYNQQYALYSVFYLIQRGAEHSEFANLIDVDLINLLRWFAINQNFNAQYVFIPNNATWALGKIYSKVPAFQAEALSALTDVITNQPNLSEPYLWAVKSVTWNADCKNLSNGNQLCKSTIVASLKNQLFTNHYSFDDGALMVDTPLTLTEMQALYHALKQVESQFDRITETFTPLNGDPTPVLKVVIYGSRSDYETYHAFLFDLPTNNGGIYVEQMGIFFTYQRTPQESTYTLEDLFRHEYVHYLVGRFLIEGFWGAAPIYSNNRMVWFDEGMAEFLAWGTAGEGVKPRKALVSRIQEDGANRMHIADILVSTYDSGFKFYRYAGTLMNYWYQQRKDLLRGFLVAARNSDVTGFDDVKNQVTADQSLDSEYQAFLDSLIQNVNTLTDPSTTFPDPANLSTGDLTALQTDFRTTRLGYLGQCTVAAAQVNGRFSCHGTLSGSLSSQQDWFAAWKEFDLGLDEIVLSLRAFPLINFQGLVCRMGKIRFVAYSNQQSYPLAEYMCDGPLPPQNQAMFPPGNQEAGDFKSTRLGVNTNCTAVSGGTTVNCETSLSTIAYDNGVSDQQMRADLESDLFDLKSDVYAIRPPYYRSLSCTLDANSISVVPLGNTQKYMIGRGLCTVLHG